MHGPSARDFLPRSVAASQPGHDFCLAFFLAAPLCTALHFMLPTCFPHAGFNILFEQLVLEMGYDAEASRQAIVALPAGTMDDIIDYIIDKEAIFAQWRLLKSSLLARPAA